MPYLPPTSHVTLLATLRRERMLPRPGAITVENRQRVEAADVVGRANVAERHYVVEVARALGVAPQQVEAAMLKQDGDPVKSGEPIAARKGPLGLGRRLARAPADGRLVTSGGGKTLLAAFRRPFELRAALPGVVVSILQSKGVVIESIGALLEGVWGNGRDDLAPLQLIGGDPNAQLLAPLVQMEMRGTILAAGSLTDPAAVKRLAEVPLRGLIVGHLAPALLPDVQKFDFPMVVAEGFGAGGFSRPAADLLAANAGRGVWLNARPLDHFYRRRPELIVPLPGPSTPPQPPAEGEALAVGKRVRVLRGPAAGRIGAVSSLTERPVNLPSGLRARVATVDLDGVSARVPFANLELLE